MNTRVELAKFFAGFAACDLISHTWLALSGLLPLHVFGIHLTPVLNGGIIAMWSVVIIVLIKYAWFSTKA